jgi:hypothetical protein
MFKNVLMWKVSLVLVISGCLWNRQTHSHYVFHASEFLTFFTHTFKQIKIPIPTEEVKKIASIPPRPLLQFQDTFIYQISRKYEVARHYVLFENFMVKLSNYHSFSLLLPFRLFLVMQYPDLYFTGVNESLTKSRFSKYIQVQVFILSSNVVKCSARWQPFLR